MIEEPNQKGEDISKSKPAIMAINMPPDKKSSWEYWGKILYCSKKTTTKNRMKIRFGTVPIIAI